MFKFVSSDPLIATEIPHFRNDQTTISVLEEISSQSVPTHFVNNTRRSLAWRYEVASLSIVALNGALKTTSRG